ncbi:MAG: phosphate/phosphite/phosphonate ABC transporter substrate-binding protein [Fimbriimonadaceae bacterium]
MIGRSAVALAVVVVAACSVGCRSGVAAPGPASATPAAGSAKGPDRLVFAFQRQKDPAALKEDAEAVGKALQDALGTPVDVLVPTSYGATVQALISGRAHVAYLSSLPFLLAERETGVEILLVEERNGQTEYDSIFVVGKDSPIQNLGDLKGKRMAFTSPTSASGYVFPYGFLVERGLIEKGARPDTFFAQTQFAGSYDRALMAVLQGQADVAAVSDYTMEGPTADKYLPAAQRARLRILARVPGVPTHLIAVRSDLPGDFKAKIRDTLLTLAEEQPDRLRDVYGAASFVVPAGDHIANSRAALERTGLARDAVVE